MDSHRNINLRSEKVRNIIGKIPSRIIRSGIMVITVILILLILGLYFIPYPDYLKTSVIVTEVKNDAVYASAYIPYQYIEIINKGMVVDIELDGYSSFEYGYIEGVIEGKCDTVIVKGEQNFFTVFVIAKANNKRIKIREYMRGTSSILLSNLSILEHILSK